MAKTIDTKKKKEEAPEEVKKPKEAVKKAATAKESTKAQKTKADKKDSADAAQKAKSAAKEKKAKEAKKKPAKKATKKPAKKWDLKFLGGALFAKMLKGGATELRTNAEEVNKLNVFPVPDGDTGDNMTMTIESGVAAIEAVESDNIAEVMKVLSRGMLLGARGNSGVILSQFFAGLAKGLSKSKKASPAVMGKALELGVEHAYASVMTPTEGTILTVAREAVEYAVSRLTAESTIKTLFADLVEEMRKSL